MTIYSLKPFEDKGYLSEEEALRQIEGIPIPRDYSGNQSLPKVEPTTENRPQDNPTVDLEGKIIDLNPADRSSNKTQDQWIEYFNSQGRIMVSMPYLYLAGKSNNQALLDSLRKDFKDRWIISSTRIKYENNQNARIIHNYGSKLVGQVEHRLVIPEYRPILLTDVLGIKVGLLYLQTLFGTKDNAQQIKETLQKLSKYTTDKTKVWSAALSDRPIEMVAGLGYCGEFHVGGNDDLDYGGRSRGVSLVPR